MFEPSQHIFEVCCVVTQTKSYGVTRTKKLPRSANAPPRPAPHRCPGRQGYGSSSGLNLGDFQVPVIANAAPVDLVMVFHLCLSMIQAASAGNGEEGGGVMAAGAWPLRLHIGRITALISRVERINMEKLHRAYNRTVWNFKMLNYVLYSLKCVSLSC